jgi:hypothetical protein
MTGLGYVKNGSGTLTLSGTSTFTNFSVTVGIDINGGVVSLGSSAALGNMLGTAYIGFGGGTLQYSSSNTTDYSGKFK